MKQITPILLVLPWTLLVACGPAGDGTGDVSLDDLDGMADAGPEDTGSPEVCVPDCEARDCGPDGCGGTCGACLGSLECNEEVGICIPDCSDEFEPDNKSSKGTELLMDEAQVHSICPAPDKDWFHFSLDATSDLQLEVTPVDHVSMDLWLYDEALEEREAEDVHGESSTFAWKETPPGKYYLAMEAADWEEEVPAYKIVLQQLCTVSCEGKQCGDDGCGGTCGTCGDSQACNEDGQCSSLCVDEFEPDDSPEIAHFLEFDVPRTHSICPGDDSDWFTFSLEGLSNVRVWSTTAVGQSVDMYLFDSQANELDDTSSEEGYARIDGDHLTAGTYFVMIESSDEEDQVPHYVTHLEVLCVPDCDDKECGDDGCGGVCGSCGDYGTCGTEGSCESTCVDDHEPDDDYTLANPLTNLAPRNHSLCPAFDNDWFQFSIPYNTGNVHLEISGMVGNTEMWLYDPDGLELDYDDDSGVFDFSLIEYDGLPKGVYWVLVNAEEEDEQVPDYQIFVKVTCAPDCEGKECGFDGCGGTCGSCVSGSVCTPQGNCVSSCIDGYEPDGDSLSANLLLEGVPRQHTLCPAGDRDWLAFSLAKKLEVQILASSKFGGIDLWLYNVTLNKIESEGPGNDGDTFLEHGDLDEGIYYVEVAAEDEEVQLPSYTITLTTTDPSSQD